MPSTVTASKWGTAEGQDVWKYTLSKAGQEVDVITYGATITAVRVPDKNGKTDDVVLGYDSIDGYLSESNPYFGATVGRVANRIGKGRFCLNGKTWNLFKNRGQNTLHGGARGWSSKVWNATHSDDRVVMTLLSDDSDQGFPGAVIATVTFNLDETGLVIDMNAVSTEPTPVNMTNHSYFNLAGQGTNAEEMYKHQVQILADRWTVTDSESIPTGELRPVRDSIMDLNSPKVLGDVINRVPGGGYDYNFCVPGQSDGSIKLVARVVHPGSGRFMEVRSNQPGVQFYTANFLPETGGIKGKGGREYLRHGALCLETQNYPDAVNNPGFPDSILRPGSTYCHTVVYKFGVGHN